MTRISRLTVLAGATAVVLSGSTALALAADRSPHVSPSVSGTDDPAPAVHEPGHVIAPAALTPAQPAAKPARKGLVKQATTAVRPATRTARTTDDRRTHVEPGDDRGTHAEPGDDRGTHVEPGDDSGGSGHSGRRAGSH